MPRAILVHVGEDHPLEEATALRNSGNRSSYSTRPDDENAHAAATLREIVRPVGGMRPEDVYELTGVSDPRLRPGGEDVAYVIWSIDKDENEYRQSIWLAKTDGSAAAAQIHHGNERLAAALVAGRLAARVRLEARRREGASSALRDARRRRRAASA